MKVAYDGPVQHSGHGLSTEDFKKAGFDVEEDMFFPTGEAVEVSDELGEMMISDEGIFVGIDFIEVKDEETKDAAEKPAADGVETKGNEASIEVSDPTESAPPIEGPEATTEGTATPDADGDVSTASTGRTSARGRTR